MSRYPPLTTSAEFIKELSAAIARFRTHGLDDTQRDAIFAAPERHLHIVAGPGSGKTTVLVLRLLYLVFVHGYLPAEIIATTFTRKAAAELRSRVLAWGYSLRQHFIEGSDSSEVRQWLSTHCEFSDARIGTFDSLVQELITEYGPREEQLPVTIEPLTATSIMLLDGIIDNGLHNSRTLKQHLTNIGLWRANASTLAGYLRQLSDRLANDLVDEKALAASSPAMARACAAVTSYRQSLSRRNLIDYSGLSLRLLELLRAGSLNDGIAQYRILLVDEFQDTNSLQEASYLEIFRRFGRDEQHPASLTVVGDDDQSIFRFRGATVEIFTNFPSRVAHRLQTKPQNPVFLNSNYRSRGVILTHFDSFVSDSAFVSARVDNKPKLVARTDGGAPDLAGLPVLGMFDDNRQALAQRIRNFLIAIFRGDGFTVRCAHNQELVIRGTDGHDFADAVFLGSSVQEQKPGRADPFNLTGHLRAVLEPQVPVFNPRGRALHEVSDVQVLLGLFAECVDPNGTVQRGIGWLHAQFGQSLDEWRQMAQVFVASDPKPGGLPRFMRDWATRTWRGRRRGNLKDWPALELLFTLTTWLPRFCDHPEYQVYFEAVTRAVEQASPLSGFGGRIVFQERFAAASVKHLLINVLAPIAGGGIDVDEDLIPHVPRHWFPVMTIHQAKGLEFPLVIVDVGSGSGQEVPPFLRFPTRPSTTHYDEDLVAPFSELGILRQQRDAVVRARDDLKRKYFVAFSRAQSVLLMVGHTSYIRRRNPLPSIQIGTRYDETRMWRFMPAVDWTPDDRDAIALI